LELDNALAIAPHCTAPHRSLLRTTLLCTAPHPASCIEPPTNRQHPPIRFFSYTLIVKVYVLRIFLGRRSQGRHTRLIRFLGSRTKDYWHPARVFSGFVYLVFFPTERGIPPPLRAGQSTHPECGCGVWTSVTSSTCKPMIDQHPSDVLLSVYRLDDSRCRMMELSGILQSGWTFSLTLGIAARRYASTAHRTRPY
jgi:hypothetical protein